MRYLFGDHVTLAHLSMAGLAGCACCRMHPVAEEHVGREAVDANPWDRLLFFGGCSQLLNGRAIGLHRLVAAHAETLCGEAHHFARLRVFVARVALQAQGQVRPVAIGNRLLLAV